jgi:hypothetical protein
MPHELLTLSEAAEFVVDYKCWVIFIFFCAVFCRYVFLAILFIFIWPLQCMFLFYLLLLITPLVLSILSVIRQLSVLCISTRRMPLVKKSIFTLPDHLSSCPDLSHVRIAQSSIFHVIFGRSLFALVVCFLVVIVLSVLLQITDSTYPFGYL